MLSSERIAKYAARAIREAPELTGQEEVLQRGRVLAAGEPMLLAPLERLAQLYQLLCSAGHRDSLLLDLGEFRGFDYYDGVVFDVFAPGVGAELGGGGRYDHLIGRFGRDLPSTGFALDVDRLFSAVDFPEDGADGARIDYLVAGPHRSVRRVIEVAGELRRRHRRVVQHTVKGNDRALIASAIAAGQAQRADALIVVGTPGMDQDHVVLFDKLCTHDMGRRNGRVRRPSMKKVALSALMALARRSRRATKEPS